MSSTSESSGVLLQIQRRAQNRHIPKSILNIIMAIDAAGGGARKGKLETSIGVKIHQDALVKSELMELISHVSEVGYRKKTFIYSLTRKGRALLSVIITGKEIECK